MATNTPSLLTSLTVGITGNTTALTAPSGTAVIINYMAIARRDAGAAVVSMKLFVGSTAAIKTWLPATAIGARRAYQFGGAFALSNPDHAVVISAASASAFDITIAGLYSV